MRKNPITETIQVIASVTVGVFAPPATLRSRSWPSRISPGDPPAVHSI